MPFPDGWQLPRPTPEQRAERMRRAAQRAQIKAKIAALEGIDLEAVRLAIDDMEKEFPGRYDAVRHRQAVVQFERDRAGLLKALVDGPQAETASADPRSAPRATRSQSKSCWAASARRCWLIRCWISTGCWSCGGISAGRGREAW